MTATPRLYYQDCYTSAFDAQVIDLSSDGKRVYLDKTYFYPTSGGQPHDTGLLGEQAVLEVVDEGERIAHLLVAPLTAETVSARIDWTRRYDHMQQHTGQHLLSAVFIELYEIPTLSFHMSSDVSTIELGRKELSDVQIDAVENRVNEIVREARDVRIVFEDAGQASGLRKERARTGVLRIVEIEGLDRSACGGTHVRSTAELGPIQIRHQEKIRGNTRIEFVCGIRALRRSKSDFRILTRLARESATAPEKLSDYLASLKERVAENEKEQAKLILHLGERDGTRLYESTTPSEDGIRRAFIRVSAIDAQTRAAVSAFISHPRTAILVMGKEPPAVLLGCSPDAGIHAGVKLKDALSKRGGRGGGSATVAQGSLPDSTAAELVLEDLGFGEP
jgi:alanyl-tRNA synthetase